MASKILIDASDPEGVRVVVLRESRVEEFDFESSERRQLKGNIYLSRVTRVEPALQAAFVDYGGNRHGFLPFVEVHPDYYQIPVEERQAIVAEEDYCCNELLDEDSEDGNCSVEKANRTNANGTEACGGLNDEVEVIGSDDRARLTERRMQSRLRQGRSIQDVIKRGQLLLVQLTKEERGNKGATLTTYLSLAGRYSVLLPNTARGCGVSRKIANVSDRNHMKAMVKDLSVPVGMGVILRTAGAYRTKNEIRRDLDYLFGRWKEIRELTLSSTPPMIVYEEGSLIKRAIRDLYNDEIDSVIVSGEDGYRSAKNCMRALMPSHAKAVRSYKSFVPIFTYFDVERQLDEVFKHYVDLPSGGYIVIDRTEALVAIDVNSGRSTRESSVEGTALRTNLEAAREIARQLRLRDLAGLIVVDFIDMEERRNNQSVESVLRECLRTDRARIHVGRISAFGLLEMSRQRLRSGVLESSTVLCAECAGVGLVRSDESTAMHVLRSLEEYLLNDANFDLLVRTRASVAMYILNQRRAYLMDLEKKFNRRVTIVVDDHVVAGGKAYTIERKIAPLVATRSSSVISAVREETDPENQRAAATGYSVAGVFGTDVENLGSSTVANVSEGSQSEQYSSTEGTTLNGAVSRNRSRRTRRRSRRVSEPVSDVQIDESDGSAARSQTEIVDSEDGCKSKVEDQTGSSSYATTVKNLAGVNDQAISEKTPSSDNELS